MQYRTDRYGNPISVLGYGCMRFAQTAGKVDVKKAEQELLEAYRGGVNYFDTAYVYPGREKHLHGKTQLLSGHIVQVAAQLVNFIRHWRFSIWFIMEARYPAPKPLSMFTTDTPLAQELSILSSAATPLKAAP